MNVRPSPSPVGSVSAPAPTSTRSPTKDAGSPKVDGDGIAVTVRLTRATLTAKRHMAPEVEAFLKLARDLGLTLAEAIDLLDSA